MSLSLVAFDTDRIKEYVFAGDALRDIRGASSILDQLNRELLPDLVGAAPIFAAGGSALVVVPSAEAAGAIERVRRAYADASGGAATITGVALPLPDDFDLQAGDIRPFWRLLSDRLAAAKARTPPFLATASHPLIRYDAVDDAQYAAQHDPVDGFISLASQLKRTRSKAIRDMAADAGAPLPETFEKIADWSRPAGYFALVVADGDRMGRLMESCPTLPAIGKTARALSQLLGETVEAATRGISSLQRDYFILGGDDIVLAVPAQHGLPVALRLVEEFARRSPTTLGQSKTLSVAVVWAHMRYPFAVWRELAEGALRFAKREAERRELPGGLINFLVVSSANHLEFGAYHRAVLTTKESATRRIVRTMRPYSPADLRTLMHARAELLAGVPRSKLEALNRAVFQPSSRQAMLDALKILVHWHGEQSRKAVVEFVATLTGLKPDSHDLSFPFALRREPDPVSGGERETYVTPLADLAEVWDFLPGGRTSDAE